MKKITLVEAFEAMRRWEKLPVNEQISLLDPDTKSYTAQIITNDDDHVFCEFMLNGRFFIESELIGAWELHIASSDWFACGEPNFEEDDAVKYIKDAWHFKRYSSIDAKLKR